MAETITDVRPFTRVKDVDVEMTVVKPPAIIGLGNLLILHEVDAGSSSTAPKPALADAGTGKDTPDKSDTGKTTGITDGKATDDGNKTINVPKITPVAPVTGVPDKLEPNDVLNGVLSRKTDPYTGAQYVEYATADAVGAYYDKTDPIYIKSDNYFMQEAASDRIAVLNYPKGKLADALKAFWYYNWTFMIFDKPQFTDTTPSDDAIIASNICEANKDHFLVLQATQPAAYVTFYAQNYTIGLIHDLSEPMDAALIGATATLTVGSVTWKFRKLKGITADQITVQEKAAIDRVHAIAYIEVSGQGETSEGWVLSGDYIDSLHGDLWVKVNMGDKIQKYLQNTDKVPYDQRGINALAAICSQVLQQAYEQGIVLEQEVYDSNTGETQSTGKGDYSVTATPRSAQSQKDLSARHYGGLSFRYHRSGAIHTVLVHGTVQSDTFTNSRA